MARGDIRVVSGGYGAREFDVDDRNTSAENALLAGEPVKRGGAGNNFAIPIVNGDPEGGTDVFLGIVNRGSTETATVDGKVEVLLCGPGTILTGDATTGTNIDTAADLLGLMLDFIAFDVAGASVFTFDEDQNAGATNVAFCIVGGDIIRTRVFAMVVNASLVGSSINSN